MTDREMTDEVWKLEISERLRQIQAQVDRKGFARTMEEADTTLDNMNSLLKTVQESPAIESVKTFSQKVHYLAEYVDKTRWNHLALITLGVVLASVVASALVAMSVVWFYNKETTQMIGIEQHLKLKKKYPLIKHSKTLGGLVHATPEEKERLETWATCMQERQAGEKDASKKDKKPKPCLPEAPVDKTESSKGKGKSGKRGKGKRR